MTIRCEKCLKFLPDALEKKPIKEGDKVSFINTTRSAKGVIRMSAKDGVVQWIEGDFAAVKVPRMPLQTLRLEHLEHQGKPNALTVHMVGMCECNKTESQKEAQ
ncbi:hypothetical protein [Aeromonas sp. L_1B5_3]|uniref:hypothetical protein n=1 Tax=Aeromonas sp. L_1B5_3 TaxID=1588629 RepID=UPI0005B721D1|nr:hypothetical protein [Aeromonas sp. L_1B5_3]KIQ84347.1 hypothetical protein RW26_02210 [Aeromonas sp. L_1B5_3]